MPLLTIRTNRHLEVGEAETLLTNASETTAQLLGKPESYVMVSIDADRQMSFGGSTEPLAYLELKSIGLPETHTKELSAGLCSLINTNLDIPLNRIYIEFANAERHFWGWNGTTF